MKLKIFSFLIFRYLFSSWAHKQKLRQGFALGTLVPVSGVAIGVFAFTVVLSVMAGFVHNMKAEILTLTPHLQIKSFDVNQNLKSNPDFIQDIKNIDSKEILAASPYKIGDGIIQSDNQATLVTIEGIDPISASSVSDLTPFLVAGEGFEGLNTLNPVPSLDEQEVMLPGAIIGRDLALQLNLTTGSVSTLVSILFDEGLPPIQMPVVIIGVYDTGRAFLDSKVIYISLSAADKFFSSPNTWTGVQLKLKDPFKPENILTKLKPLLLKENLIAEPWTVKNSALLKALFLEHLGMMIVMTMIILVGCFSITISLLLSLRRKTRELAILRGLGLSKKDLSKLYLFQGFIIGLIGVLIGLVLGLIALYILHNYRVPFITDAYSGEPLPILINYVDLIIVSIGSIILATFAAFWPAFEVRRLNVIEVLAIRQ